MYVYRTTNEGNCQVGYYEPGRWRDTFHVESTWEDPTRAVIRVHYLNGGEIPRDVARKWFGDSNG